MTRGGRAKDRDGPERRCIATGAAGSVTGLIRFALSPDRKVVPDLAGKLPGRGAWLSADRAAADLAVKKNLFSRAFRQPVQVEPALADLLEALSARRLIEVISLARKAGQAVTGAEKVKAQLAGGGAGALIQAIDGAPDGKSKLHTVAKAVGKDQIKHIEVLTSTELGLAFGREFAIHAALDAGGFADRACAEAKRLSGLRISPLADGTPKDDQDDKSAGTGPAAKGVDEKAVPVGGGAGSCGCQVQTRARFHCKQGYGETLYIGSGWRGCSSSHQVSEDGHDLRSVPSLNGAPKQQTRQVLALD
ncbi:MAG: RNA-binding protein, partial [Pseudomonadota bacterium]